MDTPAPQSVFARLRAGEHIHILDPDYRREVHAEIARSRHLCFLANSTDPDDAARIYIRPDYTSGAPLWPKCRYPRRHRLNLFGVEGRNFGRLVR